MKSYKFLDGVWLSQVEDQINSLAMQGWAVKSFTVVAEGETNDDKNAYVLLEHDNRSSDTLSEIVDEIQAVNESLSNLSDKLGKVGVSSLKDQLHSIEEKLGNIEYNTSN